MNVKRWCAGVGVAVVLAGCGGSSSSPKAVADGSSSSAGPTTVEVDVLATAYGTAGLSRPAIGRSHDGSSCGVPNDASVTGFDMNGKVDVTARDGKLLGSANLATGVISTLETIPSGALVTQTCRFRAMVTMYELPTDAATVAVSWPASGVSFSETQGADAFRSGATVEVKHTF